MKFLTKIIALCSVLFVSITSVFAIDAPVNIQAENIDETSITLSWNIVDTAFGYHIYYSDVQDVEILTAQKKEYVTDVKNEITQIIEREAQCREGQMRELGKLE